MAHDRRMGRGGNDDLSALAAPSARRATLADLAAVTGSVVWAQQIAQVRGRRRSVRTLTDEQRADLATTLNRIAPAYGLPGMFSIAETAESSPGDQPYDIYFTPALGRPMVVSYGLPYLAPGLQETFAGFAAWYHAEARRQARAN
jgi:hypothetical protein